MDRSRLELARWARLWPLLLIFTTGSLILAGCGEDLQVSGQLEVAMTTVPPPLPTVTPLGWGKDGQPTPTPAVIVIITRPTPPASTPAPNAPKPPDNQAQAQQPTGPVLVEGVIQKVEEEKGNTIVVVNDTRYIIIPNIVARLKAWLKPGATIKMRGTHNSDGTYVIDLVINVTTPKAG